MTATRATNPKEERRLLHQQLSRTQLLDAAEEIFGQKGFHETTLKEIADRGVLFAVPTFVLRSLSPLDSVIGSHVKRGDLRRSDAECRPCA